MLRPCLRPLLTAGTLLDSRVGETMTAAKQPWPRMSQTSNRPNGWIEQLGYREKCTRCSTSVTVARTVLRR